MAYTPFVFPAPTGSIDLENNVIDDVGTELVATHWGESYGLASLVTTATVIMKANEIRNVGRNTNGAGPEAILTGGVALG